MANLQPVFLRNPPAILVLVGNSKHPIQFFDEERSPLLHIWK
jgi:hypothetical protein